MKNNNNFLVGDIAIIKAIPTKAGARLPNIKYCQGWHDHQNMGMSRRPVSEKKLILR